MDPLDTEPLDRALGDQLRALRALHNMTRQQLADKVGISAKTIQRIENGERTMTVPHLYAFCDTLDAEPDELVRAARASLKRQPPSE